MQENKSKVPISEAVDLWVGFYPWHIEYGNGTSFCSWSISQRKGGFFCCLPVRLPEREAPSQILSRWLVSRYPK